EKIAHVESITHEHAIGTMLLIAVAYGHQFEKPHGRIPPGTFARTYDAEDNRLVEHHLERMRLYVEKYDAQYWLLRLGDQAIVALDGLAKVSPSRATRRQKLNLQSPNCYINDIMVAPQAQNQGNGSRLMHAPLAYGGFEPGNAVALDAYKE